MSKITIRWLYSDHDCDTCGSSYAMGAEVELDGVLIHSLQPSAHCYGGEHYDPADVYKIILEGFGYSVEET